MTGHRSRGPWRYFGRQRSARIIMAWYRDLDRACAPSDCAGDRAECFAWARHLVAFNERLDSLAVPGILERRLQPRTWTA
jgi:hypothetical protein